MALTKEQYQAFEAVVGPENISEDPVDLDAWAWRSGQAAMAQDFKPRFEAILMPASTEEVQAIVRLCNKFDVQFKASSTGWGVYCDAGGPGCIKLDLRRMNRITRDQRREHVRGGRAVRHPRPAPGRTDEARLDLQRQRGGRRHLGHAAGRP